MGHLRYLYITGGGTLKPTGLQAIMCVCVLFPIKLVSQVNISKTTAKVC